jgi:hypothetical protein
MKAFTIGLMVGAFGCFVMVRWFNPTENTPAEQASLNSVPAIDPPAKTYPSCPEPIRAGLRTTPSGMDESMRTPKLTRLADVPPTSGIPSTREERKIALEDLSEDEASDLCQRAYRLRAAREQAAKDAEPKDAAWAYSTEQLIRQHVEANLPADQYSVLKVECRTTYCELRLEGTSQEGRDLAEKVGLSIPSQPWSDIAQGGQSGGSDGTKWHMEFEWFRPTSESERRQWLRNRD